MRTSLTLVLLAMEILCGQVAQARAAGKPAAETGTLIATVLGNPIALEQITPVEAPLQQKQLPEEAYQAWLRANRTNLLHFKISAEVLRDYAIREKLRPGDDEIDAILREGMRKYGIGKNSDRESQKQLAIELFWVRAQANDWKVAKALYERFGGRVALSSFGACTAIDGRRAVIRDYAAAGKIKFHDPQWERAFWEKNKDDHVLTVTLRPEAVAAFFAIPPWEPWLQRKAAAQAKDKDKAK
jgi:hypothetical protein